MAIIKTLNNITPQFGKNCFFAENSTIIGDVVIGDDCSIWFNAVIRGDVHYIRIGDKVNIQDGVVVHATYKKSPTNIGNNVSIAHNAIIHGCTIKDNVLIGMGAIIMDDAVINEYSVIAAGAVIKPKTIVESGSVYAGTPAVKIKDADKNLVKGEIERIAESYLMYASWYKND